MTNHIWDVLVQDKDNSVDNVIVETNCEQENIPRLHHDWLTEPEQEESHGQDMNEEVRRRIRNITDTQQSAPEEQVDNTPHSQETPQEETSLDSDTYNEEIIIPVHVRRGAPRLAKRININYSETKKKDAGLIGKDAISLYKKYSVTITLTDIYTTTLSLSTSRSIDSVSSITPNDIVQDIHHCVFVSKLHS